MGVDRGATLLARDALATPDLRRLQLAAAAAGIGGWAFMVALAIHAYAVGGAAAVGLAALVRMVPGRPRRAADRPRRPTASRAATCCSPRWLARALLLGRGHARRRAGAPLALLLIARHALHRRRDRAEARAGRAAAIPRAEPSRQAAANAVWTGIDNGAFVVGAMAGGALVAAFGAAAAFAASADRVRGGGGHARPGPARSASVEFLALYSEKLCTAARGHARRRPRPAAAAARRRAVAEHARRGRGRRARRRHRAADRRHRQRRRRLAERRLGDRRHDRRRRGALAARAIGGCGSRCPPAGC